MEDEGEAWEGKEKTYPYKNSYETEGKSMVCACVYFGILDGRNQASRRRPSVGTSACRMLGAGMGKELIRRLLFSAVRRWRTWRREEKGQRREETDKKEVDQLLPALQFVPRFKRFLQKQFN